MPRSRMDRIDIEPRILKLKDALHNGTYMHKSGEWHDGAHEMLNKVLDMINEYRY